MANKLSFDINMNTAGYVQGARQAQQSTKDLEKSTNKYLKEFGSLRKELGAAKKEAQNLAMEFSQLSKAEKQSEIGKQMAKDLNFAIEKAAELQDVMGDVNESIKNAASDTKGLDAFKEAMTIGKNVATTYAGAVAKLTGNDKALTDVVSNLAMVEGGFNTIISVSNALQKQSALMKGINIIQTKALTAATNSGTVAQAAFNAVANANPYVLLASVVAAAALAIGGYMLATSKATDEEEKHKKKLEELKKTQESYTNSVASEYSKTISTYRMLQEQWRGLRTEQEKNQFLKDNQQEFEKLTNKVKDVASAEKFLITDTENVVKSFQLRAEAAANAAAAIESYSNAIKAEEMLNQSSSWVGKTISLDEWKKLPKQLQDSLEKSGNIIKKYTTEFDDRVHIGVENQVQYKRVLSGFEITGELNPAQIATLRAAGITIKELDDNLKNATTSAERFTKKAVNLTNQANKLNTVGGAKDKKTPTKEQLTYLGKLEKKVSDLKKDLENIDPKAPNFNNLVDNLKTQIAKAEKEVKDYKISIGLEVVPVDKSGEEKEKALKSLQAIFDELNKSEQKFDFSGLSDKDRKNAEEILEKYQKLVKARDEFKKVAETTTDSEAQYAAVQAWIDTGNAIEGALGSLMAFVALSQKLNAVNEHINKMYENFGNAMSAVNSLGNAMNTIGEMSEDKVLNVAGIVAQAIAQISLSFAEALRQNAKSPIGVWGWIAAGAAGLAQLVAMTSQIKSINKYAEGGIIGGSSFSGDRLLARVNSGEMIFNSRQQKRLYEIANGTGYIGNNTLHIIGTTKVNGSDLDIVWTNYNRINKRAR